MGFIEKIKEFFKKLKEENAGFATTMKRINASGFCGNVNRGIKNGDFWEGSYISIEGESCVIYGSNQADYVFDGKDVESLEQTSGTAVMISVGNQQLRGIRHIITFKDGKRAQADILENKIAVIKLTLGL